jgi:uncharacterized protein YndB with AHSA1/START domain
MTQSFTATKAVTINAAPDRIWEALTTPEQVRQYMFGAEVVSDWQQGGPIVYRGMWDGKPFEDKGTILAIDEPVLLKTSYYSPLSGKPDTPENYAEVTYLVSRDGKASKLTVTQSNIPTAEGLAQSESNWAMTLVAIKRLIED